MPKCQCGKKATYRGVEVLSVSECQQIVERKLKTKGVEVLEVKTKLFSEEAPAGFQGEYYLVTIIASENKTKTSEIKLFIKMVYSDPTQSEFVVSIGSYRKETSFYSVLVPDLLKYKGELKADDGKHWSCECYLTTPGKMVLEDLSASGFRNHPGGFFSMDYGHCVVVLKTLASFHASSLIFEEKETQRTGKVCRLNEVYPDQFTEVLWVREKEHLGYKLHAVGHLCTRALLRYLPGWEGDEKRQDELFKKIMAGYEELYTDIARPSTKMRNVPSHGDLWYNNILIRYGGNDNSNPVEVKFVDFQLLRYKPPAHDFLTFLHLNTRREMRDQHLLDLARTYHDTLRAELTRHHLDVDSILPWDQFKASLDQYRKISVLIATTYCTLADMDPELIIAISKSLEAWKKYMFVDRTEDAVRWFKKSPRFKEVVIECLEELVELVK